jgi:hypothetical protein
MQNVHRFLNMVFSPGLVLADLGPALGITISSKSPAHGHFLEDLTSELFSLVKKDRRGRPSYLQF